jgi:hypothetical protein
MQKKRFEGGHMLVGISWKMIFGRPHACKHMSSERDMRDLISDPAAPVVPALHATRKLGGRKSLMFESCVSHC